MSRATTQAAVRAAIGPVTREFVCAGCLVDGDLRLGRSLARRRCKRCGARVEETVVVQMGAEVVRKKARATKPVQEPKPPDAA